MADKVWPLEPDERVRLSSFNGIGFDLKGFTRKDATGRCFATRYFTFVYLPVIPLDRFYLEEGPVQYQDLGLSSTTLTRYRITGWSPLRGEEILRTYLFSWIIGPGVVLVPALLWLGHSDELSERIGFGWVIGILLAWSLGSTIALAFLLTTYRKRWAPLRQAVILDD
jgi:hypothetical protein